MKPKPAPSASERRSERATRIADAALAVLAAEGARGLTHRATDAAAGLPQGSTSNYFPTREALLNGALQRHIELDLESVGRAPGQIDSISAEQARERILTAVAHLLEPDARALLVARFELFLESTRRPALREELSEARARFVALAEQVLAASGCERPRAHGAQLAACLDGLALDQVLGAEGSLGHEDIVEVIDRLLADC